MTLEQLQNHSIWIISQIGQMPCKATLILFTGDGFEVTIVDKTGGLIETEEGDFFPAFAIHEIRLED